MRAAARILVLCTGNSCRSQMAEAWFRELAPSSVHATSAGSDPEEHVHPLTVRAMAEAGIELSQAHPKPMARFLEQPFDYVITLCDRAAQMCPTFPGPSRRIHWRIDDPAVVDGDQEARMAAFRCARDLLRAHVQAFLAGLPPSD